MINKSGLEFTDISSEQWRKYIYSNGFEIHIGAPMWLHISESGGHRILDKWGESYCIKPQWAYIKWRAREGQPNFVK